jgi:O-antigen ligase
MRAERLGTTRLLAWTLVILLTLYLVFLGGGWVGIHSSTLRATSLVLVGGTLAVWALVAIRRPAWRPRSRILPALIVPLAVLAVTTALSRHPRFGYDYVAWSVLLAALYLLLVRIMASPALERRMLGLTAVLAAIIGIWYLEAVGASWLRWWELVGGFAAPPLRPEFASLTFGNPSAVMLMSILLALPAVAFLGWGTRLRAMASGGLLALAVATTVLSGSRAGWLGLAIGFALAGALWLAAAGNRAIVARVVRSRRLRLGLAGIAVAALVAGAVVVPGILFRSGTGGEGYRLAYYEAALRMFGESPIVGTGPGTWVAQRVAYTDSPTYDFYIPHAHNVYLQTLAETGALGAVAGLVVLFVVGRLLVRAVRSDDGRRRTMGWAAVFGLAYFGAHQLLDFYANFPAGLFAIAIPIAWLDAAEERGGADATRKSVASRRLPLALPRLAVGASVAVVCLSVGWLWVSEGRAALQETAVAAVNAGEYVDALEPARAAAASDPDMPAAQVTLGLAASGAGQPAEAAAAFRSAAEADDLPESWLGLAAAQVELGDSGGAHESLVRALRLGISQPAVALAAGDLYLRIGDTGEAADAFLAAIRGAPSLAGDPTLPNVVAPAIPVDNLFDRAIATAVDGPDAVEIALEAGRRAEAEQLAARTDETHRQLFALVIPAWFGDDGAKTQLARLAAERPFDLEVLNWNARIASRRGFIDEARRYGDWANVVNGLASRGGMELRIVPAPTPGSSDGTSAAFYGHYTYRRPTPWDLLPLNVVRVELR